jgi:hypothetical protein
MATENDCFPCTHRILFPSRGGFCFPTFRSALAFALAFWLVEWILCQFQASPLHSLAHSDFASLECSHHAVKKPWLSWMKELCVRWDISLWRERPPGENFEVLKLVFISKAPDMWGRPSWRFQPSPNASQVQPFEWPQPNLCAVEVQLEPGPQIKCYWLKHWVICYTANTTTDGK